MNNTVDHQIIILILAELDEVYGMTRKNGFLQWHVNLSSAFKDRKLELSRIVERYRSIYESTPAYYSIRSTANFHYLSLE